MSRDVQDPRLLAPECELELTVEQRGCFSEQTTALRLAWTEQHASLAVDQQARSSPRPQILALAEQICLAAERPEVPLGGRSTTSYHATLRWRFRASSSEDWTSGESHFASHDLPSQVVQDLVQQRPDLAARIPPNAYTRALGLHELALSIAQGTPPSSP
jgi:hypothetical protein